MREWHIVTVAFCCWSNSETGLPTMFERPITTASAPARGISKRRRISMMPSGVHAVSAVWPSTSLPAFTGWRAVHVLRGIDGGG